MAQKANEPGMSGLFTFGRQVGDRLGRPAPTTVPAEIPLPPGSIVKLFALGWQHGHLVTADNDFYSWGTGTSWRLASGTTDSLRVPTLILSFPPDYLFAQVECGEKFGASLDAEGVLLVWGCGYSHLPVPIDLPSPGHRIAAGERLLATCLLDGSVIVLNRKLPRTHIVVPDEYIVDIAAGKSNITALSQAGRVYIWGTENATPTLMDFPHPIGSLFAYSNFWFVDVNDRVFCFGRNDSYSLGIGDTSPKTSPVTFDFPFDQVEQIASGDAFTMVLTRSGKVFAAGKLDSGLSANKSHPDSFLSTTFIECDWFDGRSIAKIAAGVNHAAFLVGNSAKTEFHLPLKIRKMVTQDLTVVEVEPGHSKLLRIGFFQGDILEFSKSETCVIVGVIGDDRVAVLRASWRFVTVVRMQQVGSAYPLVGRRNRDLVKLAYRGKIVFVDPNWFPAGLRAGDLHQSGFRLVGSSGTRIFAQDGSDLRIVELGDDTFTRNGHRLKKFDDCFAEESENRVLLLHSQFGGGLLAGSNEEFLFVEFAGENGKVRKIQRDSVFVKFANAETEMFTVDGEFVAISGRDTRVLDLVLTPRGFGTVAGVSADGRMAVWVEGDYGAVSLFDSGEVNSVGRLFGDLLLDGGLSANCGDFRDFGVLPGDELSCGVTVVGVRDGRVFGRDAGRNLVEVDGESAVAMRRMFASSGGNQLLASSFFVGVPPVDFSDVGMR
jgi:hypothetical protein